MTIASSRLVFVGGLHRSGTTLVTSLLAAHPQVAGLRNTGVKEDEGQHLQKVYPPANQRGGAGRFAFDERAHLTESSPLVGAAQAEQMLMAWTPYWDTDRPHLVEKSPPNLLMGRFLQAQFPGSALVFVVRHPIVVALSTKKWVRFTSLEALVRHNIHAYRVMGEDLPQLVRVHVLCYERLIADPAGELAGLASFLRLDGDIPAEAISGARSSSYGQTWASYRTGSALERRRRRRIEAEFGEPLARLGYRTDDLSVVGPSVLDGAGR